MLFKKLVALVFIIYSNILLASNWTGDWHGQLQYGGQSFEMIFKITKLDNQYQVLSDVPELHQYDILFNFVDIKDNKILLRVDSADIHYEGKMHDNMINGTYRQGNFKTRLNMKPYIRNKKRQEPANVKPYNETDVTFVNEIEKHQLAGTLTIPHQGAKAVAILISGSGPSTRNADIMGHKPFLVIADQLARQGIAVLRYDDRGVGRSEGSLENATSKDLSNDAMAALKFIKNHADLKNLKAGFIGHSEGALIGAIASANNDLVSFLVSLAGPGIPGKDLMIEQSIHLQKLEGISKKIRNINKAEQERIYAAVIAGKEHAELIQMLVDIGVPKQAAEMQIKEATSPWFMFLLKTDPAAYLAKISVPVLALNGELDAQVLAESNVSRIESVLKERNAGTYMTRIYPDLNHLFQPAKTGLPNEYAQIETTFSQQVLDDIASWIKTTL